MDTTTFPADTVLFKQGDEADAAYLVQQGSIEISIGEGEARKILNTITDGALFGEMALISNQPRMATATARTDTTCVVVPNAVFSAILDNSDAFTRALILSLIGHIRSQHKGEPPAAPPTEDPAGGGVQFYTPKVGGGYREKG